VKKNVEPHKQFHVQNEKGVFKKSRQEFLKPNIASKSTAQHKHDIPMYVKPSLLDHTNEVQPLGQVSTIKAFLKSRVKLLNDQSSIKILPNMLEICNSKVEGKL
jgi:hypothetical protein